MEPIDPVGRGPRDPADHVVALDIDGHRFAGINRGALAEDHVQSGQALLAHLVDGIVAASLSHLAEADEVLFLPTQAVGLSPEHQRFAGTLTLSPETVIRLWVELGECVARAGVRKLLLFLAQLLLGLLACMEA